MSLMEARLRDLYDADPQTDLSRDKTQDVWVLYCPTFRLTGVNRSLECAIDEIDREIERRTP